ncbi:sigma 54-interacting transcriptional regulator [Roseimaritima sediminicola]|uniref:sigma 54-interacting transcriptional regulator n=1 Tax=Roseimaritima sediminicola TaxID=2662066 RepID=UPI0012982E2F|nr:sigma 54-interacting transcriptional regulator [Roseimaritima sediminicola]
MVAYLKVRSGPEAGRQYPLDPSRTMHVGRGSNCEIVLSDPIASRFHAVVYFEDDRWQVRDTRSRNGMLVNGQKTDHAMLLDQSVVQVGGTELQLHAPEDESSDEQVLSQTVQLDRPMSDLTLVGADVHTATAAMLRTETGHLMDLYQLSLSLLQSADPEAVSNLAVELLRDRTGSDVVGFLWDSGNGRLTPERVFPPGAVGRVRLSRNLTQRVVQDGEAIWIKERPEALEGSTSSDQWSDAICVPMMSQDTSMGVLHLYREQSRFQTADFEFAVASGRLIAAALASVRKTHALQTEHRRLADRNAHSDELIGNSRPMIKLKEKITRIGRASGSILVRGESGSGKELVARALHRASPRSERPLLSVNCAAIPRDLMESQLFGHRKGAFTGADADHTGWFEQAHTGTLFLDEIGELTLDGQAKLLRILEGHPFLPVGGVKEVNVDVRVIAATNRDLAEFVRERKFREDLYYRLSVFELIVPPLRDRGDDIAMLLDHFLEHFRRQHGRPNLQLDSVAREHLLQYPWPGNVRQLRNVIDSAVVMAEDPMIELEDLGLRDAGVSALDTLRIDLWEKRLIRKAIKRTQGSIPEAAKLLGISRATAYRKIAEYEIDR